MRDELKEIFIRGCNEKIEKKGCSHRDSQSTSGGEKSPSDPPSPQRGTSFAGQMCQILEISLRGLFKNRFLFGMKLLNFIQNIIFNKKIIT